MMPQCIWWLMPHDTPEDVAELFSSCTWGGSSSSGLQNPWARPPSMLEIHSLLLLAHKHCSEQTAKLCHKAGQLTWETDRLNWCSPFPMELLLEAELCLDSPVPSEWDVSCSGVTVNERHFALEEFLCPLPSCLFTPDLSELHVWSPCEKFGASRQRI